MSKDLSEQEVVRRESLKKLRDLNIDPYPAKMFEVNNTSKKIKENYNQDEELEVVLAGRIMSRRIMGKASFAELQDADGKIQLYVNRDEICLGEDKTMYNTVFKKLLDIGDIIGIKGHVFTTKVNRYFNVFLDYFVIRLITFSYITCAFSQNTQHLLKSMAYGCFFLIQLLVRNLHC